MWEELGDGERGFGGYGGFMRARVVEGEGAVVQHELGIVTGSCLDAQVPEHGVRFPATEEHDGVRADVSAKEGGGSAGAEGACAEKGGVNAVSEVPRFEVSGGVAQGIRNVCGFDRVPFGVVRVRVVVPVDQRGWRGVGILETESDAGESFAGAVERVRVGFVADSFPADSILLISELQRGVLESGGDCGVIQRCCSSGVDSSTDSKLDVLVQEGLRARFRGGGVQVFGWA